MRDFNAILPCDKKMMINNRTKKFIKASLGMWPMGPTTNFFFIFNYYYLIMMREEI